MEKYHGSCHCGAVKFGFSTAKIELVMRCDCSICVRKGCVLSPEVVPPHLMEISAEEGVLSVYQFATMTAQHHFCNRCGVHTFVETRLKPGHFRINLGCVNKLDVFALPEKIYPGKAI